jgi:hypothetical protein
MSGRRASRYGADGQDPPARIAPSRGRRPTRGAATSRAVRPNALPECARKRPRAIARPIAGAFGRR